MLFYNLDEAIIIFILHTTLALSCVFGFYINWKKCLKTFIDKKTTINITLRRRRDAIIWMGVTLILALISFYYITCAIRSIYLLFGR